MLSWETWHQCFWTYSISYTGLQKLYDQHLIDGLEVDMQTLKPDCVACTEGKLTVKLFDQPATCTKKIGQLTHIDLWGKYDTTSLHGRQYYILFVDNLSRYITVKFLKAKS
jgi:hypothetical protein